MNKTWIMVFGIIIVIYGFMIIGFGLWFLYYAIFPMLSKREIRETKELLKKNNNAFDRTDYRKNCARICGGMTLKDFIKPSI